VANLTTPANLFHVLRRQLAWPFRKPLVIMSPKSMLRHPLCVSPLEDFTQGSFKEVIGDSFVEDKQVSKVLLCTGKLYYELLEEQQNNKRQDVAIVRVEQLHPFPHTQLEAELSKYQDAKVYWVQEEPSNMGYWWYMVRALRNKNIPADVVARKASSSPATGYNKVHNKQQREIIERAFSI
jgi:2-oxoglutarate dehydrogenase E1 component